MFTTRVPMNYNGHDTFVSPLEYECAKHRTLTITGDITDEVATYVCSTLRCMNRTSDDDITLYINSPGGGIDAGLYIYDTIKSLSCDVATVCCGITASMAAVLAIAGGTKGKRYALEHAELMLHQPLGATCGQSSDMKLAVDRILKMRSLISEILASTTGQAYEKIMSDTERDSFFSAKDALDYGMIDRIGDPFMS